MRHKLLLSVLLTCFLLLLCAGCRRHPLVDFLFLSGTWVSDVGGVEVWGYDYMDSLKGRGGSLVDVAGDTLWYENLALLYDEDDVVYYSADVKSNPGPVNFELVEADWEQQMWLFENDDHDFPKAIQYHLIRDDSMTVSLFRETDADAQPVHVFGFRKVAGLGIEQNVGEQL